MQPFFENRYVGTLPILLEYIRKVVLRSLLRGSGAGTLLALGMAICFIVIGDFSNAGIAGIFALCFALVYLLSPLVPMYRILRASQDAYGDEEVETLVTFADRIYIAEGEESASLDYSQVTNVRTLSEFYALEIDGKGALIVARNGFTTGKEEDFLPFLQKHCTQIAAAKANKRIKR
ncbi:MAG: YcxB family protein [Clostridiales bacterium]|nr:YcxB family protein [Clostridiales bacterium]